MPCLLLRSADAAELRPTHQVRAEGAEERAPLFGEKEKWKSADSR